MIKYALTCPREHEFESWFQDSVAFDQQVRRGFVQCPFCQSPDVTKAMMAPAVSMRRSGEAEALTVSPSKPAADPSVLSVHEKMRALRRHIQENSENVGRRFPREARLMHDGDIEFRPIYGQVTLPEAQALLEDGVAVAPAPFLADDLH